MSTEVRRVALVVSTYAAVAPPGIDSAAYAQACLSDTYEVLADLDQVRAGIAGDPAAAADLLWPGDLALDWAGSVRELAAQVAPYADELVVVPADVPDLPGLVVAKVFKALQRADVCWAPERGGGSGCVAIGLRLPWPTWLSADLDLDRPDHEQLARAVPRRSAVAVGPDWHRLRTAAAVNRLDPGLEGWEMTRALLSGHALTAPGA